MISFQIFDQWHSVIGFFMAVLFFFVYPITNGNSTAFRVVFLLIVLIGIFAPLLVTIQSEEEQKLLSRSGKIVHTITFVMLFYCYYNRESLVKYIPYFFWFIYFLGLYSLLEWFLHDVLLSAKYQFYKTIGPFLENNFGIVGLEFTSPLSYLIKFILLSLLFKDAFEAKRYKIFFQYALWVLLLFELVQVFIFKSYQGYDSLSSTVKNFYILGGSGFLLFHIYKNKTIGLPLTKNSYFWICLGLILPVLTEILVEFIFSKLYRTDLSKFFEVYLYRNACEIVGFTLLIIGIWQAKYLRFLPREF